jgi:hypothetical protein
MKRSSKFGFDISSYLLQHKWYVIGVFVLFYTVAFYFVVKSNNASTFSATKAQQQKQQALQVLNQRKQNELKVQQQKQQKTALHTQQINAMKKKLQQQAKKAPKATYLPFIKNPLSSSNSSSSTQFNPGDLLIGSDASNSKIVYPFQFNLYCETDGPISVSTNDSINPINATLQPNDYTNVYVSSPSTIIKIAPSGSNSSNYTSISIGIKYLISNNLITQDFNNNTSTLTIENDYINNTYIIYP